MLQNRAAAIIVLTLFASVQVHSNANATRLSAPKTYKCAIGGEEFKHSELLSMTTFGSRLDGKPVGPLAIVHEPPQCPTNGFVQFKEKFSNKELAKLKKIIESKEFKDAKQNRPVFYLLFLELEKGGYNKQEAATALLKATWSVLISSIKIDIENEYNKDLLSQFVAYIDKNSNSFDKYFAAQFQVYAANAERQLGQFEKAQARLNKLKAKIPPSNPKKGFDTDSLKSHISQIEKAISEKDDDPYYGTEYY